MSCQTPSNRRHAEIVDEWFQQRLQTLLPTAARFRSEAEAVEALTNLRGQEALSVIQDDKWVKLMQSCGIAMAALVQQAAVHCHERGDAMSQVSGAGRSRHCFTSDVRGGETNCE